MNSPDRPTPALPGRMQHRALTVDQFLDFAAQWHGTVTLTHRGVSGERHVTDYRQLRANAQRLSAALTAQGVRPGDRIATLAMNHLQHLEAWYGIMGIGAVCHTVNPRLFREQLVYILRHAGSRLLLADAAFAELAADLAAQCPAIERVIHFDDGTALAGADTYEAFLDTAPQESASWGDFPEEAAAGLCYTSGTTGNPKGVLYSHRSNYLHALMTLQHGALNLSATDVVLPVVPMFHANAWGIAFSAPAAGASLAMPGARLDGESLTRLIHEEGVTFAAGVPTVWQGLLQHVARTGETLAPLRRVLIGGSACPPAMIRAFEDDHGVEVIHAWGMTETSPVATLATPTGATRRLPEEQQRRQAAKQGRPMFGVDLALADDEGRMLPHDGTTPGHLLVRGPTVARGYHGAEADALDANGWFDTGDVATIDAHGFMQITDRSKDLIKSGGEWISSIEIENAVMALGGVACAAVVAMPSERWGERPLLLVQPTAGTAPDEQAVRAHLDGRISRWWMPDEIRFVDAIPLGATGKVDKKRIRAELAA
jgi:fatty-acyl-CoA synthase